MPNTEDTETRTTVLSNDKTERSSGKVESRNRKRTSLRNGEEKIVIEGQGHRLRGRRAKRRI